LRFNNNRQSVTFFVFFQSTNLVISKFGRAAESSILHYKTFNNLSSEKQKSEFKEYFEDITEETVSVNTAFKKKVFFALNKYKSDNGFHSIQDCIRLFCISYLNKAGYLKK
jgi:hypothetical protein